MKKFLKLTGVAALAAVLILSSLTMLTSCNKDDESTPDELIETKCQQPAS